MSALIKSLSLETIQVLSAIASTVGEFSMHDRFKKSQIIAISFQEVPCTIQIFECWTYHIIIFQEYMEHTSSNYLMFLNEFHVHILYFNYRAAEISLTSLDLSHNTLTVIFIRDF